MSAYSWQREVPHTASTAQAKPAMAGQNLIVFAGGRRSPCASGRQTVALGEQGKLGVRLRPEGLERREASTSSNRRPARMAATARAQSAAD